MIFIAAQPFFGERPVPPPWRNRGAGAAVQCGNQSPAKWFHLRFSGLIRNRQSSPVDFKQTAHKTKPNTRYCRKNSTVQGLKYSSNTPVYCKLNPKKAGLRLNL